MKRLLTLAAMFLCCMATSFAQFSGSGSGTENDPYLILNPIQLNQLRNYLNQSGVYFKLMADIDLTEFLEEENPSQGWQPVGSSSAAFKGIVDGNGKMVSGLWIKRANTDYVGFFGNTDGATIKNLKIVANAIIGKDYVGGMSGYSNNSTFTNCLLSGKIQAGSYVGGAIGSCSSIKLTNFQMNAEIIGNGDNVGGFVGIATGDNGFINGCKLNSGLVKGNNYVGGICGSCCMKVVMDNSVVNADIMGANYVAGAFGNVSFYSKKYKGSNTYGDPTYYWYYETSVNNFGFIGTILGQSYIGGVVGQYTRRNGGLGFDQIASQTICNSYVIGNIAGSEDFVGGVIGDVGTNLSITDCYYSGVISGRKNVGGVAGSNLTQIEKSYSHASITGTRNVGGIAGINKGTIKTSIANVTSIKVLEGYVGRVVGLNEGTIAAVGSSDENKSYNRTIVISQGVAQDVEDNLLNATGVSATTLKLKATYVAMGWDFNDIWEIQETECYPYMKKQTAPPVITSQVVSGATTVSGKAVDGGTVTLEIDGVKQQMVSTNHEFSFTVSPLQAGHEVRISAKAEGKEQSYYTTEMVAYLGKGTEADPYQVYTASDLTGVYRKGYFKLMNDIDLTDYINQFSPTEGWESIGREGSETIHFDGNGHKITDLWCNSTRDNTGLFSCFANGTIKNLTVETAKNKQVKGGANTGILIGKMMNGTIINCHVSGSVADGTPVGGLVGLFDGGKISLSQATVTINTTNGTSYVGGLVGEITGGQIDQCVTQGTITATGNESYVGGLVGKNSATITNCYSNAQVTSTYNAAGLVAYNYGTVNKCYATGDLFSNNYAAGVIGYNDGANAVVSNCAAMNNKIEVVYESQQTQQGGGYGQRIIGGIKNGAPAPELNNYALKTMQVSLNNVPQKVYDDIMNGVGKTGAELMKASTYQELGWNFSQIWAIVEGEGYPSLQNNIADVVKPDDPEPEVTTDDKLTVAEVTTNAGKTVTIPINLENKTTDLSAYQFDLTLPTGFTLAKNDKGKYQVTKTDRYEDDSQSLSISLLEGNTYRFVCFSMSNGVIEGTNGAILNALIAVDENVAAGTYEAKIENIIFTKTDGTQLKLSDTTFNIVINNIVMGDANGDGEVNVADIVEIVNDILGKPSDKFVKAAADLSGDGEINVTDIVMVVNIILSGNVSNARMMDKPKVQETNGNLMLAGNEDGTLSLSLDNQDSYVASQFDLRLADGQRLDGISLNKEHSSQHLLTYKEIERNHYRVVTYSLDNESYAGKQGELLNIQVTGSGNVEIDNILFVTERMTEKRFLPLRAETTGIRTVVADEEQDVYTIDGRLVRKQTISTDGLAKGVYIINGKKHVVR